MKNAAPGEQSEDYRDALIHIGNIIEHIRDGEIQIAVNENDEMFMFHEEKSFRVVDPNFERILRLIFQPSGKTIEKTLN